MGPMPNYLPLGITMGDVVIVRTLWAGHRPLDRGYVGDHHIGITIVELTTAFA